MKKIDSIIILGSGHSTRFWPLTDKTTFKVMGKSLLAHQLDKLKQYSDKFFISANDLNKSDIERVAAEYGDLKIKVFTHDKPGQAQAILAIASEISGSVLIVNVNDFFEGDVVSDILLAAESDSATDALIAVQPMDEYFDGGYVTVEGNKVRSVVEKPGADNRPSNLVRLAVDYFRDVSMFVETVSVTVSDESARYEMALSAFSTDHTTRVVEHTQKWYFLKYPWDLLNLLEYFLKNVKDQISKSAVISQTAILTGSIYIGENVTIGDFAKIVGPCYIDDNTIIGDYALVRQSYIGQNSTIGGYSEVARSYVGDSVMLHRNYIGDTILDDSILMGSGTTCANFRFDSSSINSFSKGEKIDTGRVKLGAIIGRGAKVGVNTTLLPGIKIGRGTFIGPAETIRTDIEDDKFVTSGEIREKK